MKLIISEHVNALTAVKRKEYSITVNAVNDYNKIPKNIGETKGDIIAFRGGGDPVRFPIGENGAVLTSDSTAPLGMRWTDSGGNSGSVTLHAPEDLGVIPAYSIVCLAGTCTNGIPDLKLATGTTAGEDLYITTKTVTGADVPCAYTAGSICTVRYTGSAAAAIGDPISVSTALPGVGAIMGTYPVVGTAVSESANGTVQVRLTGGCKNVEALTAGEQLLAGDAIDQTGGTANKVLLNRMCAGVTCSTAVAKGGTGLFAVKAGDIAEVNCNEEEVVAGDWLIPSKTSGYGRNGSGYGIGRALEAKAAGSVGKVRCRLAIGHYGIAMRKWYLVDGITEDNVVAAYKFKGAANETEALDNVNDNTSYPLSKTDGVTWTTGAGLLFPAAAGQYILNAALIAAEASIIGCAFGYNVTTGGNVISAGVALTTNKQVVPKGGGTVYSGSDCVYLNTAISRKTYFRQTTNAAFLNGCLSCNYSSDNLHFLWHDGIPQELTSDVQSCSSAKWPKDRVFSTSTSGTKTPTYLYALVFYNTWLTQEQHEQIASQINAL